MKKPILIFLLSSIISSAWAQTNFSMGFVDGYKKGYCYGQNMGCVVGVIPITPIPDINESLNNYVDGYNRGFLQGKNTGDNDHISQQRSSPYSTNNTTIPYQNLSIPLYHPDFSFYQQILANAETQYKIEHKSNYDTNLSEHDNEVITQLENPDNIRMQENYIKFLKLYYTQVKILPSIIPDGVYDAIRIGGTHDVNQAKVVVKYGKIIEISTKNPFDPDPNMWYFTVDTTEYPNYKKYDEANVLLQPVPIINGKAIYPIITWIHGKFYDIKYNFEIYFIDYISSLQKTK